MIPTRSHHEHNSMHTVHAPYRGYLESSWGMREQPRVRAGEAASSTTPFAGEVLGLLARMMEIDNRPASSSYMYLEHFSYFQRKHEVYRVSKVPEDVVCKVPYASFSSRRRTFELTLGSTMPPPTAYSTV